MSTAVAHVRARYSAQPVATAAILFAVLAAVRLSGAASSLLVVVSIAVTPLVLAAVPRSSYDATGLRAFALGWPLAKGVAAVIAAYAVSVGLCVLAFGTGEDNWARGVLGFFSVPTDVPFHALLSVVLATVCLGLVVPIAEEVCYRGVLHHAATTWVGPTQAVVITAAGWALVHLGDYGLAPFSLRVIAGVLPSVFLMGLALGYCRVITGSVFASCLAQGAANLLLAVWVAQW